MTASLSRRAITLLAACLLQLLLVTVLVRSLRSARPAPATVMVFVSRGELIKFAPASGASSAAPRRGAGLGRLLLPQRPALDWRSLPLPSIHFPAAIPRTRTPPDWARAAREAAIKAAGQTVLTQQRLVAMDELPEEHPQRTHASFPWSRQPLTPWFDFDAHTLTASLLLGKHCELVFLVILPGFGCLLGHLDDHSRGDLFDPALLPPPLQLPAPLLPVRQRP